MSGGDLFEHPIIKDSGFSLVYGTEIPTHDPGKVDKFRDVEPCPMGVQLLQITGMVKNAGNFVNCPLLKTQVRIVHLGKEIVGMTAIGVADTGFGFLLVTTLEVGNTEIVIERWDLRIGGDETF